MIVAEPDPALRNACRRLAEDAGFKVSCARDVKDVIALLRTHVIDAMMLGMPERSRARILDYVQRQGLHTVVVVLDGGPSVKSVVRALKTGAFEYLGKPISQAALHAVLRDVATQLNKSLCTGKVWDTARHQRGLGNLIGVSPQMEHLHRIIAKAAQSKHPVLILGESGTGKELVARSVHFLGPCREKPFIPVDCASLVPTLIESELFGYVKGAFTGALRSKEGLLTVAAGGTVFLDEVGELPLNLQAKLLRALQEKEIRLVGGTRPIPINVRVLAATNRDLERDLAQGTFRRDLYFRLNVLSLRIPPLRERKQDIPVLVAHFLDRLHQSTGIRRQISDQALEMMLAHDWPGNVRELENCLERACALSPTPKLQIGDMPELVQTVEQSLPIEARQAIVPIAVMPIAELEKHAILQTVEKLNGDKRMAARLLGIGKTTLYRKLREYGFAE